MDVRAETIDDVAAIRRVNVAAFGRLGEADLVDRLRNVASTLSFVAVDSGQIVGHIFFSPVTIAGSAEDRLLLGLAPVAVLPEFQRRGVGSLLIRHGLAECDRLGCKAVVVLGSTAYYSRFGFMTARLKGLTCEYDVPDEAFMVLELAREGLAGCAGVVQYHPEFKRLEE